MKRKLICEIRLKQLKFLGHIIRKDGFENLVLTGKIEGKRSRGRKGVTWMSSMKDWLQERGAEYQEVEMLEKAKDRELWHDMITIVQGYGT